MENYLKVEGGCRSVKVKLLNNIKTGHKQRHVIKMNYNNLDRLKWKIAK